MVLDVRRLASVSVIRVLFILIGLAVGTPEELVARVSPQQQSTPQGVIVGTVSERGIPTAHRSCHRAGCGDPKFR